MMSSVISARLEFQCGHAALVSLPRVKNESAAVRNERVAREKRDALTRPCDFCGPLVVEVVGAPPTAAATTVEVSPLVTATNGATAVNGHQASAPAPLAAPAEPPVPAEAHTPADVPVPAPAASAEAAPPEPPKTVVATTTTSVAQPPTRVKPARRSTARRTTPAQAHAVPAASVTRRYAVRFRVERVLQAADLHDALRLAESFGAEEVFEIALAD